MSLELLAVIGVTVVAIVAGVTSAMRRRSTATMTAAALDADTDPDVLHHAYPGAALLARLRNILDRSVAAYLLRRLLRRPVEAYDRPTFPGPLSLEQVARRIGSSRGAGRPSLTGRANLTRHATPRPLALQPPAASPATSAVSAALVRRLPDPPGTSTPQVRRRLIGDTGAALAGLAAVALFATIVASPAPGGAVLGASATPGAPSVPSTTPADDPVSPTPTQ